MEDIKKLVAECEAEQPLFSSLGTPYFADNSTTAKIIAIGKSAVPALSYLLAISSPKAAACIAFCLGRIGDDRALPELEKILLTYEHKDFKTDYDYAFIGNAGDAIELLKRNN